MKRILAVLLLVLAACGKRGDPRPPVPAIPRATSDLLVTQRGTKVILTWGYPSLTTAGQSLHGVRRVTVFRYVEELPPPPAGQDPNAILPGDIDRTQPPSIAGFAKVPPVTPAQFNKLKQTLDSIDGANLPDASVGAKLEYDDTPPFHAADGRPVRVTYSVVTIGESARSDLSNLATIVPVDIPLPPGEVKADPQSKGVMLSWTKPEKTATGAEKPFISGYNIYRAPAAQPSVELDTPVNAAPVADTSYTDVPAYGEYRYRVTAVASPGPPRIESDPSSAVTATFKDLTPPPSPTNINALIETRAVRLVWDAVEAPDLAGYKVFRTEGLGQENIREIGTTPLFVNPVTTTTYVDTKADLGIAYKYGVAAVDRNGNESARVWTGWVIVPKTP